MDLSKKVLTLLAIFCLIASATAVCAADTDSGYVATQYADDDSGYAGSQYVDDGGWAGSQYQDDGGWAGSQYNESAEDISGRPIIDPDYAHHEPAAGEQTNATGNFTAQAATEPVNATGNASASHTMPATGNPILLLLGVGALLGGYTVLKRKD